jgi:hypothetical protein
MPNTSKSSKKAAAVAAEAAPEFVDTITPLVLGSVERVAELQKKTLDLAAEQTGEFIAAWKKAFSYSPVPAPTFVWDVAGQAVQTAIETQKSAIDLVVEQTKSVADIAKARAGAYSQIVDGVTATVKKSVERSVEAQTKVLEFASEQSNAAFAAAKKQLGSAAEPVDVIVDTFQRGTEAVLEAQKSILNIASQPFTSKN